MLVVQHPFHSVGMGTPATQPGSAQLWSVCNKINENGCSTLTFGQLCVARYLRCTELCKLMRLSHEWFYFWISDRSWAHQRNRICARFPDLQTLFKEHAAKNNNKKTQDYLGHATCWNLVRVQALSVTMLQHGEVQRDLPQPKVGGVGRFRVPHDDRIEKWVLIRYGKGSATREGTSRMYVIHIAWNFAYSMADGIYHATSTA
jgi:hypothetical protein